MIPENQWHDNGDGTAWVVGTEWWATTIMRDAFDRVDDDGERCAVDLDVDYDDPGIVDPWTGKYTVRVEVVPGMVLPIMDEAAVIHGRADMPAKCITARHDAAHVHDGVTVPGRIALPSDAAPGMWAVKVKLLASTP